LKENSGFRSLIIVFVFHSRFQGREGKGSRPFPGSGGTTHKSQKEKLRQKKEALPPEKKMKVAAPKHPFTDISSFSCGRRAKGNLSEGKDTLQGAPAQLTAWKACRPSTTGNRGLSRREACASTRGGQAAPGEGIPLGEMRGRTGGGGKGRHVQTNPRRGRGVILSIFILYLSGFPCAEEKRRAMEENPVVRGKGPSVEGARRNIARSLPGRRRGSIEDGAGLPRERGSRTDRPCGGPSWTCAGKP
jgi:hypothetical protein